MTPAFSPAVRVLIGCVLVAAGSGAILERGHAQGVTDVLEYREKAAYLLNFTRYVEWRRPSLRDRKQR